MTNRLDGGRLALAVVTIVAMVVSLFAFAALPARADHIPDTGTVPSNCVEFQAGETGTKSPSDFGDASITLDSWDETPGDPHQVSFTIAGLSGTEYVDVSLKSGQIVDEDGPFFNGPHTILTLNQNAISHIKLCVFEGSSTKGRIIVEKEVTADSNTTVVFDFTSDYGDEAFQLSDGQKYDVDDLEPGAYSVDETVPDGWTLQDVSCVSTDTEDDSTPDEINLSAGETITCTFLNHEIPIEPEPGRIIVDKIVTDGSDVNQEFEFDPSWDENFMLSAADDPYDSGGLAAGTDTVYSVAELDPPEGWALESVVCESDATDADIDPAQITLTEDETVTCVFTNDEEETEPKPGRIIVKKQVDGEETQQTFDFEPSYGEPFSLGDGQENDSGELDPGTYSVSEDVPSGWSLTSSSCVSSLESDQTPGAIELGEGETVTCTFVNERRETPPGGGGGGGGDRGVVRVIKRVVGDDSGTLFTFEGDVGGEIGDGGTLTESAPVDESFTSTETVPAGWQLEGISCDADGGRYTIGSDTVVMTVTEDDGEVTCTFTNKRVDDEVAASILVTVGGSCVVDNAGSGVGVINVTQAVAGGATVVIKSGDTVVATFTEDGSVNVPEGQTYTWEATANAGFEFPADFVPSGAIAIDTCSQETLPFTGVESDRLLGMAVLLLGAGTMLVLSSRRREEG